MMMRMVRQGGFQPHFSTRKLRSGIGTFVRDEQGAMTIFSLFLFVGMIMMGGLAVDLMRFERERAVHQQTCDRAVLAAASLRQSSTPTAVVDDYFGKAGLGADLKSRSVTSSLGSKAVSATSEKVMPTFFMHMMDIDTLAAPGDCTAEEAVGNIEISLVLDISGSMRFGGTPSQITNLKFAAKEFFKTVLDGEAATTTSINLVQYAGQVNVGSTLFSRLGGTRTQVYPAMTQTKGSCLELQAADYATIAPPPAGRKQTTNFMQWAIDTGTMEWGWCPADRGAQKANDASRIRIAQNNRATLDGVIDGIRLHDGTGTHNGVKYGVMLLNPAMRSHFAAMTGSEVPSQFSNRPMNWTSPTSDVAKYLIIMTDGEITEQFRPLNVGFKPDGDKKDNEQVRNVDGSGRVTMVNDPDTIDGTDYDLWNSTVELEKQPSDNRTTAPASGYTAKNANRDSFYAQCNFAKNNGVIVFTIAFNSTTQASNEMRNCASSPGHFFAVNNSGSNISSQINSAFQVIARSIRQLRLTQ